VVVARSGPSFVPSAPEGVDADADAEVGAASRDDVLGPLFDEHQTWLRVERGLAANSLDAYRRDLHRYRAFLVARGVTDIESVSEETLFEFVRWLSGEGLAPSSVARVVAVVRSLHRFAAAEGFSLANPASSIESPRVPDAVPRALAEPEVVALLESPVGDEPVALRDRAMLEVLYGTGMRVSELTGLDIGACTLEAGLVRVLGKGSKERVVPVGRLAIRALEAWLERGRPALAPKRWARRGDADAVFLNQRGGRLTRQGAWLIVEGHAARVGLSEKVWPHVLRHSCATHMLERGADLRVVQELLGHARISTTQRYTRITVEHLRQVVDRAHPRSPG
jgi:integrase/recombinase XerD